MVGSGTVATLIRQRVWDRQRRLNCYYVVTLDGTGLFVCKPRHCAQCLTRTLHGVRQYYPPVLEAKWIAPSGRVCSLLTDPRLKLAGAGSGCE